MLVLASIVLLPVLLPLAAAENSVKSADTMSKGAFNDLDKLSMGHVKENSSRLWAFVIATYWVSFVAYYLLWKAYNHVSDLRAAALLSPIVRAEQFALVVRDIPPPPQGQTRKEQVDSYFQTIYPDTFYRSMVVAKNLKDIQGPALAIVLERLKHSREETFEVAKTISIGPSLKSGSKVHEPDEHPPQHIS